MDSNLESNSGTNPSGLTNLPALPMPVAALSDVEGANTTAVSQPSNLTDLLKLSTSLQTEESSTSSEIDPARSKFLREALSSLSIDVVNDLRANIQILQQITDEPANGRPPPNKDALPTYEEVFEAILDQVESIDMAQAFYQIGGLEVMRGLLVHKKTGVQALAANVIAVCCRNNPFCQNASTDENLFSSLVNIAETTSDLNAKFHAISAISAIVRDNPKGIDVLRKKNSLKFLIEAMDSANEKLVVKTSRLISALCDTDPKMREELFNLGIVDMLISLIKLTSGLIVEHFLHALLSVTHEHPAALRQCLEKQYAFYNHLCYLVKRSQQEDAYQDIGQLVAILQSRIRDAADRMIEDQDTSKHHKYELGMFRV